MVGLISDPCGDPGPVGRSHSQGDIGINIACERHPLSMNTCRSRQEHGEHTVIDVGADRG
jgi:hypothetical protein